MKKTVPPRVRAGFSLVEVALALGVAAFCLIPLFGLLPIGVNTNRASFERTSAVNVASEVVADLRATVLTSPPTDQTSSIYGITIPAAPPGSPTSPTFFVRQDGTLSGTVNQDAVPAQMPRYRVSLYFSSAMPTPAPSLAPTPSPVALNAIIVRVRVTWPALADPRAAYTPSPQSGSFETVAALVRN